MMKATENIKNRKRLNKTMTYGKEWADKHIMSDYAQYDKYEKSFIKESSKPEREYDNLETEYIRKSGKIYRSLDTP